MAKYRFKTKPFLHQKRGLVHLWKRKRGGMLAWEPGTGKTKTAIDFVCALGVSRVLVLCPINAIQVWPAQLKRHSPFPYETLIPDGKITEKAVEIRSWTHRHINGQEGVTQYLILNYDAVIKRDKAWDIMAALEEFDPEVLILDESQKIKNATTKRAKAAHVLSRRAEHVVLMTGTPVSKYLDLYSQLKCLDPMIWQDPYKGDAMSWTRFRMRYAVWGGRSGYELRGYQNLEELRQRYKPWLTTARKRSCLDLPKTTDVIIPVELNRQARRAYDIFSKEGLVVVKRHLIEAPIILTKLLRLQEMTGGGVHDELGAVVEFQRDKMAIFGSLIDDLHEADEKVVVFARFIWEMDAIRAYTNTELVIRGGVSQQRRKEVVREFIQSEDAHTILIQIGSGEALDGLQLASSVAIFYSTDYSWEHYSQARGRLERQGQEDPITFYHLHVRNSVDKLVYRALRDKRNLEREVMDDPDLLVVESFDEEY